MSFPPYVEYKESNVAWIGRLPAHWEVLSARRLFDECRGAALPEDEQLSATQRYGVIPQRLFMEAEDQKVVLALSGTANFKRVQKDDFVISLRSFQGGIEHSNYEGCVSPAYTVLRPNRAVVPKYWSYILKSTAYISALQTVTAGIRDGKNISYSQFGGLEVPVPPLKEQRAIANMLDHETAKIDALIAEQEKLLALLAEKRQATISHAVTRGLDPNAPMKDSGIPWLGEVPAHWSKLKLLDIAQRSQHSFVNGPFGSDLLTGELVQEGVPVIYIRDIKLDGYIRVSEWCVSSAKAEQLKFCNVVSGDVIVAKVGDPPGLAAVYPEDEPEGIVTQDVIRLRPDRSRVVPSYIRWLLNSTYGQTMVDDISVESTRARVGLGEYKQLRFFFPPPVEQECIASWLDAAVARLSELKSEAERVIGLLKERRSALIAAAVTGQIDVRGAVESEAA